MEEKIEELKKELSKIGKLNSAIAIINWDVQTYMPENAIQQRATIIEHLSGEMFLLKTSEKMGKLLKDISRYKSELSKENLAIYKLAKKDYDETKKIPEHRYREFIVEATLSENAWHEARKANNFEIFKPYLKKMIDFKKEFINYLGYKNNKYDALLNQFEEGLTSQKLDHIFEDLKGGIMDILNKINNSNKKINREFLYGAFNKSSQERFSKFVISKLGFDFNSGRLDESIHPFTTSFGNKDVRLTTNYSRNDLIDALFSAIHEAGHGIYEQNVKNYLGVYPNNDNEGILQDIHWSDGSFGYFPSYSLGNIYSAQMLNKMKNDYADLYKDIRRGEFKYIHKWLKRNVHQHGAMYSPIELMKVITGEELNSKYFLDYLNKKYSEIYLF